MKRNTIMTLGFLIFSVFCRKENLVSEEKDPAGILLNKIWMMKHSAGKNRFDSHSLSGASFQFKKKNGVYKVWRDEDSLFLTEYQKVELTQEGTIKFSMPLEKPNEGEVFEIKMKDNETFVIVKPTSWEKSFPNWYFIEYPFYVKEAYENAEKKLPGR